ncbi:MULTISPECIES: DUF3311 domain-containing protein [Halobacterium]|uniref:DUF3311 domain-containing protein n=1 Tax=Halobacterium TaxID=2239 RepID=UPI00073EB4E7|nr:MULTISPECIES: DUF3311 domain-containing protein [Halobacterium]MCG1003872.1 DUF3311 domain-containing protein [Halobacterium noricense]
MPSRSAVGWGIGFVVLAALAIPWFLWDDASMVAGLPVWIWWHIGWMVVTAAAFAVFARRDWGLFAGVAR